MDGVRPRIRVAPGVADRGVQGRLTKLFVPTPRDAVVRRPRRVELLDDRLRRDLTLLCAPAGFGKTTLLTDWVTDGERPVAWVSLDAADSDPARFLGYLIAVLLLTRAFRSVVFALKAVVLNLASLAAAFGIVVVVFQQGHGSSLWGVGATGSITAYIPPMILRSSSACRWTTRCSCCPGCARRTTRPARPTRRSSSAWRGPASS